MSSTTNQSFLNSSRNTSRRSSLLFSNRSNLDDTMASRQSREESLISASRYKSPFYEGKVSFGGSSAKRVRLSQVLPYNLASKPTNLTRIKDSDIKRQEEFDQLSSATKSMLQNIYKASSPLEDAKKIPVFTSATESTENNKYFIDIHKPFKRLSSLRTPKLAATLKTSSPIDREKLQLKWEELENLTAGQTVNNHHSTSSPQQRHPQNSAIGDAKASRNYYHPPAEEPHASGAGGKMRSRLTRTNRLGKWSDEDYPQQQPSHELPNMPLPINQNSLPKFNFNKKPQIELRAQTLVQQQNLLNSQIPNQFSNVNCLKRPLVSITQDDSSLEEDEFQFSAPKLIKLEKISDAFLRNSIRKDLDEQPKVNFSNQIGNRTASAATAAVGTQFNQQQQQQQKTSTITSTISSSPNLPSIKTTSSTDLMSSETNKTVGMYKLDKLDTDFNPKENKATLANTNLPTKIAADSKLSKTFNYDGLGDFEKSQMSSKSWECDMCSIRNDFTHMKCAACDLPRLKESKDKNVHSIYSDYAFGVINTDKKDSFTAFKLDAKPTAQQPPISLVSGNNNAGLSGALSTINASTSPISTPALNHSGSLSSVLTPNKVEPADDSKAPSIALSSKPLANSVTPVKETKPFNFITSEVADKIDSKTSSSLSTTSASSINTWGAQFLPPKDNWSCPKCLASNKSTDKKCPCCEEPNPSLPKETKADAKTSTGISFGTSSTGGFKFNLAASGSIAKNEFSPFLKKTTASADNEKTSSMATGGFVFGNLDASAKSSAPANDSSSAPKFSFQSPLANSQSSAESKSVTEPIKALANLANSKEPVTSTNLFQKAENSSTSNNTSSLFSMPAASTAAPATFLFGKDTNGKVESKPATSMLFGTAATVTPTNNLNNSSTGGISFNLPQSTSLSTPAGLGSQPASTGFFNSTNNTSNSTAQNSFAFGTTNKPQFGLPTSSVQTNLFAPSLPATNNLTNGFGSITAPVDQSPANNLFLPAASNNQPPAAVNNFANVFSQVPSTFNFGSDQAANQSVFQFSAPKSDAPLGQPALNSVHGRFIKKAKRRLGGKE